MSKPDTLPDSKIASRDQYGMTAENWRRFDAKTDEELAADVASDPDSAPIQTPEQLARMRRVALAKLVRQKLAMSREAFAASYGIPLDTLNAWERHEAKPTPTEESYLRLIEREPERAKLAPPLATK